MAYAVPVILENVHASSGGQVMDALKLTPDYVLADFDSMAQPEAAPC